MRTHDDSACVHGASSSPAIGIGGGNIPEGFRRTRTTVHALVVPEPHPLHLKTLSNMLADRFPYRSKYADPTNAQMPHRSNALA